jgi:hypothetical protein
MKKPFTLVPTTGASDTAKCVEALAAGVREKKLLGLAYVVFYDDRGYETHLCGEAARSPTFTRGAVGALYDKVCDRQHGR